MAREAYEDIKRGKTDKLTNNQICRVLINNPHDADAPTWTERLWSSIRCGNLVLVEEGEQIPADMVVIKSSQANGECFVQTSNLDGERALKHKQCLS